MPVLFQNLSDKRYEQVASMNENIAHIRQIVLMISNACNLRCKYCFCLCIKQTNARSKTFIVSVKKSLSADFCNAYIIEEIVVNKKRRIIAPKTKNVEINKVLYKTTSALTLNSQFKSIKLTKVKPITAKTEVTTTFANMPDDIVSLAETLSFAVKSFTSLFLIPFPMPKSKFKNHIKTDKIVYHTPSTALLLK